MVKYTSKFFAKTKGSNSPIMFYAAAFDNIVSALKGRRIFERFGFNLDKQEKNKSNKQRLTNFKKWQYDGKNWDWVEEEGSLTLSNYKPSQEFVSLINNNIDRSLE